MDAIFLSRIQFALTSMFHYIYPPLSVGLGILLVVMEGIYLKTKNPLYRRITKFWVNIFALTFALGVATGLVQLFGFGTNWARYSKFVGDVFGSALGAEGVFAFFLEAGFLGILLFGWERVKPGIHYLATILVCVGAHFSAVWIVVANSWMQTPTGYKIVGEGLQAKAVVTDFWEMMLNPSSIDRIVHVLIGCWLSGIFLVLSVSAYYYLKKRHLAFSKACMKIGLIAASIALVLQLISADSSAKGVATYQPSKLAAMEGVYKTEKSTPMMIFGWIDEEKEKVTGLGIPGLLSFFVYRDFSTPVVGFDQIAKEDRPPSNIVFQSYHTMIYMWGLMVLAVLLATFFWKKGSLAKAKMTLLFLVFSVLFPQIANQVGWMTAEIGRQPWIVYGVLRTTEGVSTNINANQVVGSIIMFICIYILLFTLFIYLLNKKIQHGPEEEDTIHEEAAVYQDRSYT
ncbi:MAG: cytochrome ubiquinol oxidase subunit I [Chlamydiae bacterium]|nr:cytochrome ubiquinol oxidase subunit I [Chlamydiota bacterium]